MAESIILDAQFATAQAVVTVTILNALNAHGSLPLQTARTWLDGTREATQESIPIVSAVLDGVIRLLDLQGPVPPASPEEMRRKFRVIDGGHSRSGE